MPTRKILMADVEMYLSAANQMATVGDHTIKGLDPLHLYTAMAESNFGTLGSEVINRFDPKKRPHAGCDLEQRDRRLLPIFSAQDASRPTNDLAWAPLDFTRIAGSRDTQGLPLIVVLDREFVDENALVNQNKIIPKKANNPNALMELQGMGYATLLLKGRQIEDTFMRKAHNAHLAGLGEI